MANVYDRRAMRHRDFLKRSHNVLDPRFSPTAVYPGQDPSPSTPSPAPAPVQPTLGPGPATPTPPAASPPTPPIVSPPTSKSSSSTILASTSSSTSTQTTTSTTSSPTTIAVPSTPTPTLATPTTPPRIASPQTSNFTWSVPSRGSVGTASAIASPSASAATGSNISTGAIVGGIAAAGVAIAGIIFTALFFIRRSRKLNENEFNANAFRRQSAVLVDDAASDRWNPRPPTMIERRMQNASPAAGYGEQGFAGRGAYGGYQQPSFSPGQYIPSPTSPPPSSNSANPLFTSFGPSPIGSPVSAAPYDSAYNGHGQLVRQPSSGEHPSKQNSSTIPAGFYPSSNAHYVDLNRSSVTPFQAAQYEEISRRLHSPPNSSALLGSVAEETAVNEHGNDYRAASGSEYATYAQQTGAQHLLPPTPHENAEAESPFMDPELQHKAPVNAAVDAHHVQPAIGMATTSDEPDQPLRPPSPARVRVVSVPPTLPEIQNRAFSPISYDFPAGPGGRPTPSPLGSSFGPSSPLAGENFPAKEVSPVTPPARAVVAPAQKRPDTVYSTMYDEGDAYGGI